MKGMRAIKLGNLAKMAQVMIGPLVEHVGQLDFAEFGVDAGALASGGRQTGEDGHSCPAAEKELLHILARRIT